MSGLHLRGGEYVALAPTWSADGTLVMYSRVLGLELRIIEGELRFRDRETGHNLLTLSESNEARQRAEQERQESGWLAGRSKPSATVRKQRGGRRRSGLRSWKRC